MPHALSSNVLPRGAVLAAGVLIAGVLLGVSTVRLSGADIRYADAPTVASRSLRFEDRPDGAVAVLDGRSGALIDTVRGEAGFLRGSLRALTRERMLRSIGPEPAFELLGRADGRLTLTDPATGQRIDLEAFGPDNAGVYVRWLSAR